MRNYRKFDEYLNRLGKDIYPQAPDEGHTSWAKNAITYFEDFFENCESVLDVGCGSGFAAPLWRRLDIEWTGVTLGNDAEKAENKSWPIYRFDMSFLHEFDDESFDLVYARHVLEHSPFPLLTLMEWHRVARDFLLLIAPSPEHWGFRGRNHYSVMTYDHLLWLCNRAGWELKAATLMTNHDIEYLRVMSDEEQRDNARRIRPPLIVEYRVLLKKGEPVQD